MVWFAHDISITDSQISFIAIKRHPIKHFNVACGRDRTVRWRIQRCTHRYTLHTGREGHVKLTLRRDGALTILA